MNGRAGARSELKNLEDLQDDPAQLAIADVRGVDGLTTLLDGVDLTLRPPMLLMIVAVSPSAASAADGDELGTVIAAWGDPDELLDARG